MSNDMVNHPAHYTSHPSGVECIEITRHYCFAIGSAIKYLWRAGLKKEEGMADQDVATIGFVAGFRAAELLTYNQ